MELCSRSLRVAHRPLVDSALLGSTVGTLLSVYEGLGLVSVAAQCLVLSGTCFASVYGLVEFQVFLREKVDYGF